MIIRPIAERDIPTCAEMIATTLPWKKYNATIESVSARLSDAMSRADSVLLVGEDEQSRLIGLVWLLKRAAFDLSGYIRWLAVAPDQRGGGIGKQLLAAAEAQLQPPVHDMFLLCADFNVDAQRFYERNGYIRIGAIENYVI